MNKNFLNVNIPLDELRFEFFKVSLAKNSQKLELLPPTSMAAKYHSYRVYLQIQFWKSNENHPTKDPEKWG